MSTCLSQRRSLVIFTPRYSVRFSTKPAFWFSSLLLGSVSFTSLNGITILKHLQQFLQSFEATFEICGPPISATGDVETLNTVQEISRSTHYLSISKIFVRSIENNKCCTNNRKFENRFLHTSSEDVYQSSLCACCINVCLTSYHSAGVAVQLSVI